MKYKIIWNKGSASQLVLVVEGDISTVTSFGNMITKLSKLTDLPFDDIANIEEISLAEEVAELKRVIRANI